jgi:Flp pilus assembly protein TadB
MAQTKRRRRKHRGTQGGSIDRRGRTSRPRSREEARARARRQSEQRRELPPSWGGAVNRGLIASGIFFALLLLLFGAPLGQALGVSLFMLALYIPMGYFIDRFFYRRRQAARRKEKEARQQG